MKVPQSLRDVIEAIESLAYVEDLSSKHGLLQAINPLVKLSVTVFMIVASLFIFNLTVLLTICIIPFVLTVLSRIPMKQFLTRTSLIPMFSVMIALPGLIYSLITVYLYGLSLTIAFDALTQFLIFTFRVWFCVASLTTLVLSTGFDKLLQMLSSIRVPPIMIHLFSLTYRYFFVSIHETQSALIGKEARTYNHKKTFNLQSLKDLAHILSALFIRTYERSERVYLAMKARGFDINNETKTKMPAFHAVDAVYAASLITAFALIALVLI
ncbi:MAG: cobalt ECF transporter T component CbiQ [Candidatus Bathyarchaeia archaeon]